MAHLPFWSCIPTTFATCLACTVSHTPIASAHCTHALSHPLTLGIMSILRLRSLQRQSEPRPLPLCCPLHLSLSPSLYHPFHTCSYGFPLYSNLVSLLNRPLLTHFTTHVIECSFALVRVHDVARGNHPSLCIPFPLIDTVFICIQTLYPC